MSRHTQRDYTPLGYVDPAPPDPQRQLIDLSGVRDGGQLVRRLIVRGWRWLLPTSLGSAAISGLAVLVPLTIGRAIDTGIGSADYRACALWCAVILVAYAARALATWVRLAGDVGANVVEHDLRLSLARRLLDRRGIGGRARLPGDLLSVATTDVRATVRGMTTVTSIPGHAVTLGGSFIALIVLDLWLGVVMLVATPLLVAVSVLGVRPLRPSTRAERRAEAEAAGSAADLTAGLRVIQGLGAPEQARRRFAVVGDRALAATIRARRLRGVYSSSVSVTVGLFIAALTIVGAYLGLTGRLTIGEVVAVAGLAQTMAPPLRSLGVDTAAVFSASQASADRLLGILAAPAAREVNGAAGVPTGPRIRLEQVRIPGAVDVPLDVTLPPAGIVGIVAAGGTAQGLVDVLARRRLPETGRVTIGGRDVAEVATEDYRAHLLTPPHHPDLFDDSLIGNITLDHGATPSAWLTAVLAATTCDEVADSQPHGLHTQIGEGGHALSGGQRQRVALARALYAAPPVLVLHDPTTSVDPATNAHLAHGLRQLRSDLVTILVTTSPQWLAIADDVVMLDERGVLIHRGPHETLLEHQEYREALS